MREIKTDVTSNENTDKNPNKFAEAQSCYDGLNEHITKSRKLLSASSLNSRARKIIHDTINRIQIESKKDINEVKRGDLGPIWTSIMGQNVAETRRLQRESALQRLETNDSNMQKIHTLLEQAKPETIYDLFDQAVLQMKYALLEQADSETIHDLFDQADTDTLHTLLDQADTDTLHALLKDADMQTKQSLLKDADMQTKQSLLKQADSEIIHDLFEQGYITSIIPSSNKSDSKIIQALRLLKQADSETIQELSEQGHLTAINAALKKSGIKITQAFELLIQGDTDEIRKLLEQSNEERMHTFFEQSNEKTTDKLLYQADPNTLRTLLYQTDPNTLRTLLYQADMQTKRSLLRQVDIQTTNALLDQKTNVLSDKVTAILDFLKNNDIEHLIALPPSPSIEAVPDNYGTEHLPLTDTSSIHMEHIVKDSIYEADKLLRQLGHQIYCYATASGRIRTMLEHHPSDQGLLDEIDAVNKQDLVEELKQEVNNSLAKAAPLLGQHPVDLLNPDFTSLQAASEEFSKCFLTCTPMIKDMFEKMPGIGEIRSYTQEFAMRKFGCYIDELGARMASHKIIDFGKEATRRCIKEYMMSKTKSYIEDQKAKGQDDMKNLSRSAKRYMGEIQNIKTKLDTLRDLYSLDRVWKELTEVGQKIKSSTNPSELRDNIKSCREIADRGYYEMRDKVTACEGPLLKIREVCDKWSKALEKDAHANYKDSLDNAKMDFACNMICHEQTILDFSHISMEDIAKRGDIYVTAFQDLRSISDTIDRLKTHEKKAEPPHSESLNTDIISDSSDTMNLSTQIGNTTYRSSLTRLDNGAAEMTFEKVEVASTNESKEPDSSALTSSDILKHHISLILLRVPDAKNIKITTKIDNRAAIARYLPEDFDNSAQQYKVEYSRDRGKIVFSDLLQNISEGKALSASLKDRPDMQINKIEVIATRVDDNNTDIEVIWQFGENKDYLDKLFDKLLTSKETDTIKADYAIRATRDRAEVRDPKIWHLRIDREISDPDDDFWHPDPHEHVQSRNSEAALEPSNPPQQTNYPDSSDSESDIEREFSVRDTPTSSGGFPFLRALFGQNFEHTQIMQLYHPIQIETKTRVAFFKSDVDKLIDQLEVRLGNVQTVSRDPFDRDIRLYHLKKTLDAMEKVEFPRVPLDLPTDPAQLQQLSQDLARLSPNSLYKRVLMAQQDLNQQQDQEIQDSSLDTYISPRVRQLQSNLKNEYKQLSLQLTEAAFIATNARTNPYTRELFKEHIVKLTDAVDTTMAEFSAVSLDFPTNRRQWNQLMGDFAARTSRLQNWYKKAFYDPKTRLEWLVQDPESRIYTDPELRKLYQEDPELEKLRTADYVKESYSKVPRPPVDHNVTQLLRNLENSLDRPSIEDWGKYRLWETVDRYVNSQESDKQDSARQYYLRMLREQRTPRRKRSRSIS